MIIGAIWYVRNVKAKLIFVLDDYKSGENNQVSRKLLSSLILPSSNISHMTTTASESGRMLDVDDNVFKKVRSELMSWPGVTSQPHRFGGTEFRVNGREMGHMHGGRFADLPFPMSIRDELVKGGRALPHHVLPNSGWITFLINEESDVTALIDLFRMQYERLSNH
jgi:Family of unknown function (DUF5519)